MSRGIHGRPKFSIGTRIKLLGDLDSSSAPVGEFSVIERHFLDTTEPCYRIRSLSDFHERTVKEEDIVANAMSGETASGSKIVPFRLRRLSITRR